MYIRLISFGLICRPDVLGHSRASGPAPKPAECLMEWSALGLRPDCGGLTQKGELFTWKSAL
jgi:hypothetical protein